MAQDLWLIESQGLTDDYLERLLDAVGSTDSEQCQQLAQDTVTPDKLVIVVVGDASKIKDGLEKIAPVTVVATEEE